MHIVTLFAALSIVAGAVADEATVRVEVTGVLVVTPSKEPPEKAAKLGPVFSIKGLSHYSFGLHEDLREKAQKLEGKRVVLEGYSPVPIQNVRIEPGFKPPVAEPFQTPTICLWVTGVREAPPN